MKKEPLVSVIIPTYNRAHLIRETLDSVLAQTYQNWECIIVDDGSSDDTDEVVGEYVEKDSRFKYFHRPEEHLPGGNGARNYGFRMSQGEYVQWFDSDDLMDKDLINSQYYNLSESDSLANTCQYVKYDKNYKTIVTDFKDNTLTYGLKFDYVTGLFKMNLQTTLFKKQILINNALDEKLKKSQEIEFFHRLFKEYEASFSFTNNRLVYVRKHLGSKSGSEDPTICSDRMHVLRIIISDFEKNAPNIVILRLYGNYLYSLKFYYYRKLTKHFFKNLNFIPDTEFKFLFTLNYISFFLFKKGSSNYNKLIKLYYKRINYRNKKY